MDQKPNHQIFLEMNMNCNWVVKEDDADDNDTCESSSIGSVSEDSTGSALCSSSSSELTEEASSSSSTASSSHSDGPLYEISELMTHLPIKRGLSMFYQGKAQSFTSLERVQSIEDLPKKCIPYRKKIKSCKSLGADLDHSHNRNMSYSPKATISKRASRPFSSFASSLNRRPGSFLGIHRPPIAAAQRNS